MECVKIDPKTNTVHCVDNSAVQGEVKEIDLKYDQLVVAVGADTATFGIPGVKENTCYMKGVEDTMKIRNRIMDCLETAAIPGQPANEVDRLLHFMVVGGGPAGVEFAAELHDFLQRDIKPAFPDLAPKVKITLVEGSIPLYCELELKLMFFIASALPHILNMFDAKIIEYVEDKFVKTTGMNVLLNSAVIGVEPKVVKIKSKAGEVSEVPYVRLSLILVFLLILFLFTPFWLIK
jgi:NADH:ubiquinone reductase (non-electrogenic)